MPMSKALVRGVVKSKTCLTYTGWQGLIPSSPLPSQTDQHPAASQCVARVAIKGYRAASEVPFVVDLVAKLRDARVLAFDEFKTWSERNSINFPHMFNSQKPLAQDYINCFPLKKNALLAKRNTIWRIVFFLIEIGKRSQGSDISAASGNFCITTTSFTTEQARWHNSSPPLCFLFRPQNLYRKDHLLYSCNCTTKIHNYTSDSHLTGIWAQDLLENCSSKPLLVFSLLVMNSSHMLLEVLFMLVPSISERLKEPSRRAELLLPS